MSATERAKADDGYAKATGNVKNNDQKAMPMMPSFINNRAPYLLIACRDRKLMCLPVSILGGAEH